MAILVGLLGFLAHQATKAVHKTAQSVDDLKERITQVAKEIFLPLGNRALDEAHYATDKAADIGKSAVDKADGVARHATDTAASVAKHGIDKTAELGHAAVREAGVAAAGAFGVGHHGIEAAADSVRVTAKTVDDIAERTQIVAREVIHTARALTATIATTSFGLLAYFLAARTQPSDDLHSYAMNRTLLTGGVLLALSGGIRSAQLATRIWDRPAPRPLLAKPCAEDPIPLPADQDLLLKKIWPELRGRIRALNGDIGIPVAEAPAPEIRVWLNTTEVSPILAQVTDLNLSSQHLSHFPADLALFPNLLKLDLSKNDLDHLEPNALHPFPKLVTLTLSNNKLKALPSGLFAKQTHLETLCIGENLLRSLPAGIFDPLTSMVICKLPHNMLTELPSALFHKLKALDCLSLDSNLISKLEETQFQGLSNLKMLALGNNKFTTLPPALFNPLTNLRQLGLPHNQLAYIPRDLFYPIRNTIEMLNLQANPATPTDAVGRELFSRTSFPAKDFPHLRELLT